VLSSSKNLLRYLAKKILLLNTNDFREDYLTIARAKGKLRGKQPKLPEKQQKELGRMHGTGEYSISHLAEEFSVSRPTIYRTLARNQ
jgi:DNA invertase Pin-like site-specific DNA recombinase